MYVDVLRIELCMVFVTGNNAEVPLITTKQHLKALQDERGKVVLKPLPLNFQNHCQLDNHCS